MSTTPSISPQPPVHISILAPSTLHLHIVAAHGTDIHLHLNTNPGQQPSDVQNGEELVNTMVTEILRHPQQDFSQCLADKLGVGDLFEWFLMEQSSANKSSKEKVDTRHIK